MKKILFKVFAAILSVQSMLAYSFTPEPNSSFSHPVYDVFPGEMVQENFTIDGQLFTTSEPSSLKMEVDACESSPSMIGDVSCSETALNTETFTISTESTTIKQKYTINIEASNIFGVCSVPQYFYVNVLDPGLYVPKIKDAVPLQKGVTGQLFTPLSLSLYFTSPSGASSISAYRLEGTLPSGLAFNSSTGTISGKLVSNIAKKYDAIKAFAINNAGESVASQAIDFKIYPNIVPNTKGSVSTKLVVQGQSVPNLMMSDCFSVETNAAPIDQYRLKSGTLPTGLSLNNSTGKIDGNIDADVTGEFDVEIDAHNLAGYSQSQLIKFDVVTDEKPFTVNTVPEQFSVVQKAITPLALTSYFSVESDAGDITAYSLAPNVSGISFNSLSGKITGNFPKNSKFKQYKFTGKASNIVGSSQEQNIIFNVYPDIVPETHNSVSSQEGFIGEPMSDLAMKSYFKVSSEAAPMTKFRKMTGTFPEGITLNQTTGKISGQYSGDSGIYTASIVANNLAGDSQAQDVKFNVYTTEKPVRAVEKIERVDVLDKEIELTFDVSPYFSVNEGAAKIQGYSIDENADKLPSDITFDHVNGTFSGAYKKDSEAGLYSYKISAFNARGKSNTISLLWRVYIKSKPDQVGSVPDQVGLKDVELSTFNIGPYFMVKANAPPVEGYKASSLPEGIIFDSTTGIFSGKGKKTGEFTVNVTAHNLVGESKTQAVKFNIYNANKPKIKNSVSEQSVELGQKISELKINDYFQVLKESAPIDEYKIASGTLPPGVVFDSSTATFSGKPIKIGHYEAKIQAHNLAGWGGSQVVIFKVHQFVHCPSDIDIPKPHKEGEVIDFNGIKFSEEKPIWLPKAVIFLNNLTLDGNTMRCEYNGYQNPNIIASVEAKMDKALTITLIPGEGEEISKSHCLTLRSHGAPSKNRCYIKLTRSK